MKAVGSALKSSVKKRVSGKKKTGGGPGGGGTGGTADTGSEDEDEHDNPEDPDPDDSEAVEDTKKDATKDEKDDTDESDNIIESEQEGLVTKDFEPLSEDEKKKRQEMKQKAKELRFTNSGDVIKDFVKIADAPQFEITYKGSKGKDKKGLITFYRGTYPYAATYLENVVLPEYVFMVIHKNTVKADDKLVYTNAWNKAEDGGGTAAANDIIADANKESKAGKGMTGGKKAARLAVQRVFAVQQAKIVMRVVTPQFFTSKQVEAGAGAIPSVEATNGQAQTFRFVMNDLTPPLMAVWGSGVAFQTETTMISKFISPIMSVKGNNVNELKTALEAYAEENMLAHATEIISEVWQVKSTEDGSGLKNAARKLLGYEAGGALPMQLTFARSYHTAFDKLVEVLESPPEDAKKPDAARKAFLAMMLDFDLTVAVQSWLFTLGPYIFKTNKEGEGSDMFVQYKKLFGSDVSHRAFTFARCVMNDFSALNYPVATDKTLINPNAKKDFEGKGPHASVAAFCNHIKLKWQEKVQEDGWPIVGHWLVGNAYWGLMDLTNPPPIPAANIAANVENIYSLSKKRIECLDENGKPLGATSDIETCKELLGRMGSVNFELDEGMLKKIGGPSNNIKDFQAFAKAKAASVVEELVKPDLIEAYAAGLGVGAIKKGNPSLAVRSALTAVTIRAAELLTDMFTAHYDYDVHFFEKESGLLYAFWKVSEYDTRLLLSLLLRYRFVSADHEELPVAESERPLLQIFNQSMCRIKNQLQSGEQSLARITLETITSSLTLPEDLVTWSLFNINAAHMPSEDEIKTVQFRQKKFTFDGKAMREAYDHSPRSLLHTLRSIFKLDGFASLAGFENDAEEMASGFQQYLSNSGSFAAIFMGADFLEKREKQDMARDLGNPGCVELSLHKKTVLARLSTGAVDTTPLVSPQRLYQLVHRANVPSGSAPGFVTIITADDRPFRFECKGLDAALVAAVTGRHCAFLQNVRTSAYCHVHATTAKETYRICSATGSPADSNISAPRFPNNELAREVQAFEPFNTPNRVATTASVLNQLQSIGVTTFSNVRKMSPSDWEIVNAPIAFKAFLTRAATRRAGNLALTYSMHI